MSSLEPNMTNPETPISRSEALRFPHASDRTRIVRLPRDVQLGLEADLSMLEELDRDTYSGGLRAETDDAGESASELFREITTELSLLDAGKELEAEVAALAPQLSGHAGAEIHDELLAREQSFFIKVFTAALVMAERQPGPVALLFDVDLTLVHHGGPQGVARPAFALAVRELDNMLGDRLEIGLLSSRPKGDGQSPGLASEAHSPTFTAGAGHKLNPELIISSGDLERSDKTVSALVHGTDTEAQIEAAADVLDPELIDAVRRGEMTLHALYDSKLLVLQELITKYPDRAFVFFDDLPVAGAIVRDSPHIRGVRVHEEILDGILRPYGRTPADTDSEEPEGELQPA